MLITISFRVRKPFSIPTNLPINNNISQRVGADIVFFWRAPFLVC